MPSLLLWQVDYLFQKVSVEDIKNTYVNLPFNNIGYQEMVKALQSGEVPLYQHCTAGKDRAGLGSALILGILGVGYDEILADYMKSILMKEHIEKRIGGYLPKLSESFFSNGLRRFLR